MSKFIFVTGGVVSGLGKGITAASLGRLLKARGLKVAAQKLADAKAMAEELAGRKIIVKMKAGENGKVFGSISAKEIAASAKAQHGVELDKKKIQLAEPIRSFGDFEVPIKLHPQVTGKPNVKVQGI